MHTDALIDQLAESAEPVRRLRPPWVRAILWLAVGIPPLLLIALLDGIVVDVKTLSGDGRMVIELAAILGTAATAAICAFAATIPGASRKWFFLPVVPLAIWLANVGEACVSDWMRLRLASLTLRFDGSCFLPMVLMGLVPTVAMLIMLRRGVPLMPRVTLLFGALGIAALTNFGLRLIHVPDVSFMALIWTFGVVALLSVMAAGRGRPLVGWRRLIPQREQHRRSRLALEDHALVMNGQTREHANVLQAATSPATLWPAGGSEARWLRRSTALYSRAMRTRRLFLSVLLLLAFVLGAGQCAPQSVAAGQAGQAHDAMQVAMSATDGSTSGKCNECGGSDHAKPACLPLCTSVQAMLPEGTAAPAEIAVAAPIAAAGQHVSGWATPPDPYPPKLSLLS